MAVNVQYVYSNWNMSLNRAWGEQVGKVVVSLPIIFWIMICKALNKFIISYPPLLVPSFPDPSCPYRQAVFNKHLSALAHYPPLTLGCGWCRTKYTISLRLEQKPLGSKAAFVGKIFVFGGSARKTILCSMVEMGMAAQVGVASTDKHGTHIFPCPPEVFTWTTVTATVTARTCEWFFVQSLNRSLKYLSCLCTCLLWLQGGLEQDFNHHLHHIKTLHGRKYPWRLPKDKISLFCTDTFLLAFWSSLNPGLLNLKCKKSH